MMLGGLFLLTSNAAVLLGAHALRQRLRPQAGPSDLLLVLLLRLLLVSLVVLAAGLTGTLSAAPLGLAGLATIVLLRQDVPRGLWARLFLLGKSPWFLLSAVLGARLTAQAWLFAPFLEDALGYHLPKIAEWIQAGGFVPELGTHTHAAFPAGFELVEAWWVVFLHHDVLIELAGIEFLLLGGGAVHALARGMGLSERASLLGAMAFVTSPGFHLQATSCLNDGAASALVLSTAALLVRRESWTWLLLPIGLGMGIKPSYVYAVPGLVLLAFLLRREKAPGTPRSLGTLVLGGSAVAAGAFWYLRNWIRFGSPIHPVGASGLVDGAGHRWIQLGPDIASLTGNLGSLITHRLWDVTSRTGATLNDSAGWGAVAVVIGLPGLAYLVTRDRAFRRLTAAFGLGVAAVLSLVLYDPWSMRFVLFFPALPALAAARIADASRWARFAFMLALLAQVTLTCLPAELPLPALQALARRPWLHRSADVLYDMECPVETVGYLGGNRGPVYLLYGPAFTRRVVYLRARTTDDLAELLSRSGVRLVYAQPGSRGQGDLLAEAQRTGLLRPLKERWFAVR